MHCERICFHRRWFVCLYYLYLYLKVDELVSNALSAHISEVFIQPALECIDRWRHHNVLR